MRLSSNGRGGIKERVFGKIGGKWAFLDFGFRVLCILCAKCHSARVDLRVPMAFEGGRLDIALDSHSFWDVQDT